MCQIREQSSTPPRQVRRRILRIPNVKRWEGFPGDVDIFRQLISNSDSVRGHRYKNTFQLRDGQGGILRYTLAVSLANRESRKINDSPVAIAATSHLVIGFGNRLLGNWEIRCFLHLVLLKRVDFGLGVLFSCNHLSSTWTFCLNLSTLLAIEQ